MLLINKGPFILHHNCVAVPIYRLLSATNHRSFTAFQVKMNLTFMRHRKAVTSQFLCRKVQCGNAMQLEMLLIPKALCWSSWKCNCACALSQKCNCACALIAEVQLRLRVTCRSWQKLFAGKNLVKNLVTAQMQLRSYSEQQRAFGNSNICNCHKVWRGFNIIA